MTAFKKGDKVAWSPLFATLHAEGSIVKREAVEANAPDAQFGVIAGVANEAKTHFEVELEDGDPMVLTEDELVKVS